MMSSDQYKKVFVIILGIVALITYKSYNYMNHTETAAILPQQNIKEKNLFPKDLNAADTLAINLGPMRLQGDFIHQNNTMNFNHEDKRFNLDDSQKMFEKDDSGTGGHFQIRVNPTQQVSNHSSDSHKMPKYVGKTLFQFASEVFRTENWTLNYKDKPFRGYMLEDKGSFLDRVSHYNQAIEKLRDDIWEERKLSEWSDISRPVNVVWGSYDDFFIRLSNFTHIKTVILPWKGSEDHNTGSRQWSSLFDEENLLIQKYYAWTASNALCRWIETKGYTKARWDGVYQKSCNQDFDEAQQARSLEMLYLHGKPINVNHYWPNNGDMYPSYFYTTLPPYVFYLHVTEDAVITGTGDIFSQNLKLVPYACSHDIDPNPPRDYMRTPIYRDVFIVSQFWCDQFFHKMLECLPRIAPYLEFLQKNKDILVHVSEIGGATAEIMRYLGINHERLITGVCRAKVIYMPKGSPCGFPVLTETQLLSMHLRQAFKKEFPEKYQNMSQNNLVLIRRSGTRRFTYQELMEKLMQKVAEDYHLTFKLFPDDPVPSREIAMELFNGAKVVIAPHGAGLANMLFCEPGTLIIEGVCNPPHVNMCFQWAAHGMGHRYHGIPSERGCESVVDVEPENMNFVVRTYLEMLKDKQ